MNKRLDMISGKPIDNLAEAIRRVSILPVDLFGALDGIRSILSDLKQAPPEAILYLTILEEIRKPLQQTVNAISKSRYNDKPLPHTGAAETAFNHVVSSLRLMNQAYSHCKLLLPEDADARYYAQILHRNIYYVIRIVFEHYRARLDLPTGIWKEAHDYYEEAAHHNLADRTIIDALEGGQSISCAASYITLLLVDLANPYANSADDQELIFRLARLGAPLVSIENLDSMLNIPPFILDLGKDLPLHPPIGSEVGQTGRCLDTKSLGTHMEDLHTRLKTKEKSRAVPLGDDLDKVERACLIAALEQLYAPWMQARIPRRFHRHAGQGKINVCSGFEQAHLAISGTPFVQPHMRHYRNRTFSSNMEVMRLFQLDDRQLVDEKIIHKTRSLLMLRPDTWDVVDQSASGFRLSRSIVGASVSHGELLAIQPPGSEHYVLSEVSWLMQDASGLHMGLVVLPGIPKAVAVAAIAAIAADNKKETQQKVHLTQYEQAFLMPSLEHLGTEPSLILSLGLWKQSEGKISLAARNNIMPIMLEKVIRTGMNYVMSSYKVES
ncbi:MAG: hypothetical protein FWG81_09300 [Betaproteobacteria bacterium]|nr:hypothetical protein [Betaproteobacteria bacterium]